MPPAIRSATVTRNLSNFEWNRIGKGKPTMLAKVLSSAVVGIDATIVEVEVDIAAGLPGFTTVGLPETAVRESRERVKAAITNCGYRFPDDRITVNLAPANMKKEGTGFDLPIALGILAAGGLVPRESLGRYLILGELALDGQIRTVNGSLSMALTARAAGYSGILVPRDNRAEAGVVEGICVYGVGNLAEVVDFLRGTTPIDPFGSDWRTLLPADTGAQEDLADIKGQQHVKRALEVAAAGGHNMIMIGPPGSGKTMLARRLPSVLPALTFAEAIETTRVFSVMGMLPKNQALVVARPFRAPHHTISDAGLIGGGHVPRPGEVSLAHNGVLFLDELPEYKPHVLEVLRQPLEEGLVTISRAAQAITYPARFMLVAAMNPCPCGYLTDSTHACRCTAAQIRRYRSRISGPLMDRIDIHAEVPAVAYKDLAGTAGAESSVQVRERVMAARRIQSARLARTRIHCNAQMGARHIRQFCKVDSAAERLLEQAVDTLGLSARAYTRILKVARTIADLEGALAIAAHHVGEAIQMRSLDRGKAAV